MFGPTKPVAVSQIEAKGHVVSDYMSVQIEWAESQMIGALEDAQARIQESLKMIAEGKVIEAARWITDGAGASGPAQASIAKSIAQAAVLRGLITGALAAPTTTTLENQS
jgi:hypothetical protein